MSQKDGDGSDHGRGSGRGLRMVEFFSGIGGFRLGVERALRAKNTANNTVNANAGANCNHYAHLESCHAYEISLHANDTYRHNFHEDNGKSQGKQSGGEFTVTTKLIEQLSTSRIASHRADLWTMSPPCQPFTSTTNAKRLDGRDPRTAGFRAIMRLLDDLNVHAPKWIVVENVKGFAGSNVLSEWYACLERNGYGWREYLLSPMQLGIPNHRKRYYMIAEKDSARFGRLRGGDSIRNTLPCMLEMNEVAAIRRRPLSDYIDKSMTTEDEMDAYLVPDDVLAKPWAKSLPIVSASDTMSHCFTAAYGRVVHRATGALLLTNMDHPSVEAHPDIIDREDMLTMFGGGGLRKFTPRELLQIFGFSHWDGDDEQMHEYGFPDNISLEHRYKLIGNSVNVEVVSRVVEELLFSE